MLWQKEGWEGKWSHIETPGEKKKKLFKLLHRATLPLTHADAARFRRSPLSRRPELSPTPPEPPVKGSSGTGGVEGDVVGAASAGAQRRLGETALCPRSLIIKCPLLTHRTRSARLGAARFGRSKPRAVRPSPLWSCSGGAGRSAPLQTPAARRRGSSSEALPSDRRESRGERCVSAPRRRGGSAGDAAPGSGGSRGSGFEGGAVRGLGRALSWTAAVLALAGVARGMRLKKRRPSFFQPRGGGGVCQGAAATV